MWTCSCRSVNWLSQKACRKCGRIPDGGTAGDQRFHARHGTGTQMNALAPQQADQLQGSGTAASANATITLMPLIAGSADGQSKRSGGRCWRATRLLGTANAAASIFNLFCGTDSETDRSLRHLGCPIRMLPVVFGAQCNTARASGKNPSTPRCHLKQG